MKFAEPTWLFVGFLVIAGLVFVYRLLDAKQRAALAEFASSHLLAKLTASFSPARRMLKRGLFVAAIACIFVALARPQWGHHWVDQKERGVDIFFALDTSKSMLTQDVNPDRLTRAKMAITDFVRKLDGDRVGLIAFAGEGFLQAPLTLDYDAFGDTLDSIDVNTIPRGGTDIASAITEAQAASAQSGNNKKILILVTDGEDLQGQGIEAAKAAAKDGMVIYTVGVGTSAGGLIPVPNGNGNDFVKDDSGQFVKSHLDENTLTQIAEATGGMYQPLGQQGQGLGVIYDKAIASMPKHDLAAKRERVYEERYQLPLSVGLVLLLASMMIGTRRRTATQAKPVAPVRVSKRVAVAALAVLAVLAIPAVAQASPQSAESAYKKGDYNKAESQYQDAAAQHPDVAPLQYDLGAAAYKSGEFDTALPSFQKALSTDDPALQQQSYYNIGNTQYRIGQKTAKSAPQDTIKQWQQAVQAYDGALKLKPDDADAKFNRDFVQKKLDELQKQQQQQQKQDQKNQQDKQDKNQQQQNQQNQDQQQQQDKNQQDKSQQNQQQGQNPQQNQDQQQQQNQQQSGSKGSQGSQQDQQQQSNGQNQAQNGQQNQKGQQQQNGQQQQQPQTADNKQGQDKSQNGQQQQQMAGNQKQDQDKGQNGQQQQTAGDQQKDQQKGQGGDQQKQQMAQGNDKGNKGGQSGQAAAAAGDKDKQAGDQTADAALPAGELTKEQAKDLLNSLKGEEHILPVTADTRSAKPQDQAPLKDW